MRVLVLGAGGKTGGAVVRQAQSAGHQVTAFVRHAGGLPRPGRSGGHGGDATATDSVAAAVAGHDAVIDTIGGKTPYTSNITLETDVARALIAAMTRSGVRRLLVTSSVGVGDSPAHATGACGFRSRPSCVVRPRTRRPWSEKSRPAGGTGRSHAQPS